MSVANQLVMCGCAVFGIASAHMSMGNVSPRMRRLAPRIGLAGQPFWAGYAWHLGWENGWALGVMVAAFTVVYVDGWRVQGRAA
jgi:hypothetical protein